MLFKRYYIWTNDAKTSTLEAKKGDIWVHYQEIGASITLIDREPISPWLRPLGIQDKEGNDWYEHDIIQLNNRKKMVTTWHGRSLGWKLFDNANQPANIDKSVCKIVGSMYTHPELMFTKEQRVKGV